MRAAHVADWKKAEVKKLAELLTHSPVVGVVNISHLPSPQFQKVRLALRDKVTVRVAKRRFMKLAIEKAKAKKPGIELLEEHLGGIMPGLVFCQENPFRLAKLINQNKSTAPAKQGQVAPHDIWVKAGPTPFAPGPVIGQLGALRIKTQIEGGKIAIKEDALVVPMGKAINADAASILARLGIEPMEMGLDLRAVHEAGEILTGAVLFIDEQKYRADFASAASRAFNLAFNAAYPAASVVPHLFARAQADARSLSIGRDIVTRDTLGMLLSKAVRQGAALQAKVPEAPQAS